MQIKSTIIIKLSRNKCSLIVKWSSWQLLQVFPPMMSKCSFFAEQFLAAWLCPVANEYNLMEQRTHFSCVLLTYCSSRPGKHDWCLPPSFDSVVGVVLHAPVKLFITVITVYMNKMDFRRCGRFWQETIALLPGLASVSTASICFGSLHPGFVIDIGVYRMERTMPTGEP